MDILCDDVILEIINHLSTIFDVSLICKRIYRIVKKSKLCYLAENIQYINFKIHKQIIETPKNTLIKDIVVKNKALLNLTYQSHKYYFLNYELMYLYGYYYYESEELHLKNIDNNNIIDIELTKILEENIYLSLYTLCLNSQKVAFLFYNYIYPILLYIDKTTVFETNIKKYCMITDWYITKKLEDIVLEKHTKIYEKYINKKYGIIL